LVNKVSVIFNIHESEGGYVRYRLPLLTTISVFVLMIVGTLVVGLNAGMACPDWPLCNGHIIPPLQGLVLIEYTHRVMSMVAGFLVIVNAIVQWRKWRGHRGLQWLSLLTVPLLGGVALLGGFNVLKQLPSGFTAIDLTLSMLLISILVILTAASGRIQRITKDENNQQKTSYQMQKQLYSSSLGTTVAIFIQIVLGGFIRHSDAGTTYFGKNPVWGTPLVNSLTVAEWLIGIHMFITFLITISVMWLVFMAVQKKWLKGTAITLLMLLLFEALFGLITLSTELAFSVVSVHLGLGTLMLMISVFMASRARLGTSYIILENKEKPLQNKSGTEDGEVYE
ncbi:MAG: COX15/CtaA family protein, partial [Bacilli bacterium]